MSDQLLPLLLEMHGCATKEEMNGNFEATMKRRYTRFNEHLGKYSGVCSLVGAGPSLRECYEELTGDIMAVNSAIGFLIEKGIAPKFAMLWDAAEIVEQFAVPHSYTTYLVASRCHPKVFERLKNNKVIVWHAAGDHNILEMIKKHDVGEPLVNGGSAGVTRGIFLARALGYETIHIFGGDSSYGPAGDTHINGSLVPEKDLMVSIGNDPPKWFRTTPEWCAQIEEYRTIYAMFTHGGIKLEVHGEGMIQEMHRRLEQKRQELGPEGFLQACGQQEAQRQEMVRAIQPLGETNASV